jgi:hypothetical protein
MTAGCARRGGGGEDGGGGSHGVTHDVSLSLVLAANGDCWAGLLSSQDAPWCILSDSEVRVRLHPVKPLSACD